MNMVFRLQDIFEISADFIGMGFPVQGEMYVWLVRDLWEARSLVLEERMGGLSILR